MERTLDIIISFLDAALLLGPEGGGSAAWDDHEAALARGVAAGELVLLGSRSAGCAAATSPSPRPSTSKKLSPRLSGGF